MTESEIWKDVAEYEGFYKVSDKGNIYSVERRNSRGYGRGGRILKPKYDGKGYPQVNLHKNGKSKTTTVHRLVAEAFIPNPESLPQVNHIDEVKDNNNVENLEWCDSKYNINYGTRSERYSQARSKKVRAVNAETGDVLTFNSTMEAGRNGYSASAVSKACRGVYNTGGGNLYRNHRWSYEKAEGNESK